MCNSAPRETTHSSEGHSVEEALSAVGLVEDAAAPTLTPLFVVNLHSSWARNMPILVSRNSMHIPTYSNTIVPRTGAKPLVHGE